MRVQVLGLKVSGANPNISFQGLRGFSCPLPLSFSHPTSPFRFGLLHPTSLVTFRDS